MRKFEYFKPSALKEASDLLLYYGEEASILNGGTDLIVRMHEGLSHPKVIVDIKGIEKLKNIDYDCVEGLFVGACANMNEMTRQPIVMEKYAVLAEACHSVGSCQVRNRATMVGNIVNASPLADTATPLLVLDAMVKVFGKEGEKEISIHDFFVGVRRTCLKPWEIVTGVRIPVYHERITGGFYKYSRRNEVDLSTVCASIVRVEDSIRIALGSVAPTPIRARKTEKYLEGKSLTEEIIKEAVKIALGETSPISDVRASKEHRQEIIKVLIKRGLEALI